MPGPDIKEILADKAGYADNIAFTLNGNTITLGQIRSMSAADQKVITDAEKKIQERENNIAAKQRELEKAQLNTANTYDLTSRAQTALKEGRYDDPAIKQLFGDVVPKGGGGGTNNDPFAELSRMENDALLGPIVRLARAQSAKAAELETKLAANINSQTEMAKVYINDRLDDTYKELVSKDKRAKYTRDALVQHAVANKQFTSSNLPDLERAYEDVSKDEREAAKAAQIEADTAKKIVAAIAAGEGDKYGIHLPAPSGNGNFGSPEIFGLHKPGTKGAPKAFKSLDEAFAAAEQDSSIWSGVDSQVS